MVTGAEYAPAEVIVPPPFKAHVTAVVPVPETAAVKPVLRPRQAVVGFTPCPLSAVILIEGCAVLA